MNGMTPRGSGSISGRPIFRGIGGIGGPGRFRGPAALAVVAVVAAGLTACEPAGDGRLRSGSVAHTTDRMTTRTFERLGVPVKWFTCTARVAGEGAAPSPASRAPRPSHATVDCEGETDAGKRITLTGRVTEERSGLCVRGDLTARIGARTAFDASYLGDCDGRRTDPPGSAPTRPATGPTARPTVGWTAGVVRRPPRTTPYTPHTPRTTPYKTRERPRPTVTVTVTATVPPAPRG
ncbi:hypothetical protein [Streptomyces yaizuensis]|uniref:Lipoprotein n=1 Tax=Streptomyces yaizuensis TaxID=2989713 RepID=A0ABQ5NUU8_9ACTN|nr:hypothetical protein [Streptomyces sp. YSPA8]GLF93771.1 hypothetical protein SYYSPA8_05760 [Streptomyces sp. YSPA8]